MSYTIGLTRGRQERPHVGALRKPPLPRIMQKILRHLPVLVRSDDDDAVIIRGGAIDASNLNRNFNK